MVEWNSGRVNLWTDFFTSPLVFYYYADAKQQQQKYSFHITFIMMFYMDLYLTFYNVVCTCVDIFKYTHTQNSIRRTICV